MAQNLKAATSLFMKSFLALTILITLAQAALAADLKSACLTATRDNYRLITQPYVGAYAWKPYLYSLAPDKVSRRRSLEEAMQDPELKRLSEVAQGSVKYVDLESQKHFENFMFSAVRECYQKSDAYPLAAVAPKACPIIDRDCKSAVKLTLERLSPCSGGYGYISLYREVFEMGSQPVFAQATAKLALKTLKLVDAAEAGKTITADLFSDTKQAFIESGASEKSAEEDAFILLGVYGTRGAAMQPLLDRQFFNTKENYIVFSALGVVASAMAYLDAVTLSAGHAYSLPKNITTHCDYTRPYHFWLSAYLAHFLKNQGFNDSAIADAIHLVSTGYETMSSIGTKAPDEVFSANSYLFETQKNIAFNGVGITWGLLESEGHEKTIESDQYIEAIRNSANSALFSAVIKVAHPVMTNISNSIGANVESALKWRNAVGSEGANSLIRNDVKMRRR